jgi:hypothetical protein
VGEICSFLAFVIIAEQWILIFPEAAVDGPAIASRLSRNAAGARWSIVKTMILVWCVPYAYGTAIALATFLGWDVAWTGHPAVVALGRSLEVAASVLATLTAAVLYKKLSVDWPERDARFALQFRQAPSSGSRSGQSPEPGLPGERPEQEKGDALE